MKITPIIYSPDVKFEKSLSTGRNQYVILLSKEGQHYTQLFYMMVPLILYIPSMQLTKSCSYVLSSIVILESDH